MASEQTSNPVIKKQNPAKNKAPRGEAERTESVREITVRRTTANNNNSKKAKSSGGRKATDGRTTKTKRSNQKTLIVYLVIEPRRTDICSYLCSHEQERKGFGSNERWYRQYGYRTNAA